MKTLPRHEFHRYPGVGFGPTCANNANEVGMAQRHHTLQGLDKAIALFVARWEIGLEYLEGARGERLLVDARAIDEGRFVVVQSSDGGIIAVYVDLAMDFSHAKIVQAYLGMAMAVADDDRALGRQGISAAGIWPRSDAQLSLC